MECCTKRTYKLPSALTLLFPAGIFLIETVWLRGYCVLVVGLLVGAMVRDAG